MILANSLATPAVGTIVWTTVIFLILLAVLRAFAWKPILNAIKAREESIKSSLEAADEARKDMEKLHADNEVIMAEAREERDKLMKEARETRDKLIAEAKATAKTEAEKIIEKARSGIEREKSAALIDFKKQVASLSVDIAGKILKEDLKDSNRQDKLVNELLDDVDLDNKRQ